MMIKHLMDQNQALTRQLEQIQNGVHPGRERNKTHGDGHLQPVDAGLQSTATFRIWTLR